MRNESSAKTETGNTFEIQQLERPTIAINSSCEGLLQVPLAAATSPGSIMPGHPSVIAPSLTNGVAINQKTELTKQLQDALDLMTNPSIMIPDDASIRSLVEELNKFTKRVKHDDVAAINQSKANDVNHTSERDELANNTTNGLQENTTPETITENLPSILGPTANSNPGPEASSGWNNSSENGGSKFSSGASISGSVISQPTDDKEGKRARTNSDESYEMISLTEDEDDNQAMLPVTNGARKGVFDNPRSNSPHFYQAKELIFKLNDRLTKEISWGKKAELSITKLRIHVQQLSKTVEERDKEIEKLTNDLVEAKEQAKLIPAYDKQITMHSRTIKALEYRVQELQAEVEFSTKDMHIYKAERDRAYRQFAEAEENRINLERSLLSSTQSTETVHRREMKPVILSSIQINPPRYGVGTFPSRAKIPHLNTNGVIHGTPVVLESHPMPGNVPSRNVPLLNGTRQFTAETLHFNPLVNRPKQSQMEDNRPKQSQMEVEEEEEGSSINLSAANLPRSTILSSQDLSKSQNGDSIMKELWNCEACENKNASGIFCDLCGSKKS